MVSNINPDFITTAPVSKSGLKAQLEFAKNEISALQANIGTIGVYFTQVGTGAEQRSWSNKMAELGLYAGDFGADFTGVTDAQADLQNLFNAAASQGKLAIIPDGVYRVNSPLTLPAAAAGLIMRGKIVYYGTGVALTIGSANNTSRVQYKWFDGIHIENNATTDWSSESDIGVLARNCDNCYINIRRIKGFTIGLRTLGAAAGTTSGLAHGFEDNLLFIGQIVDCRYGIDIRTDGEGSWNNANRYFGGHFANSSSTNVSLSRFGVRLSRADILSYDLHNQHVFYAPSFELQRRNSDGSNYRDAIPFLVEVAGRGIVAHDMRMEACTNFTARHMANAQDCFYDVAYVGSWGYNLSVDYDAAVTRAGGTVRVMHQMGGVEETQRLVADVPSVREAAYFDEEIEVGGKAFEKLAILFGTAAGATLDAMVLTGGRDAFELTTNDVGVNGAYALGFIVDCSSCKEFSLAVGGSNMQMVVAQWDGSQNELGSLVPVRFAGMSCVYNATARWWAAGTNFDATTPVTNETAQRYYEHQRITLHPSAQFAFIGVLGEGASPITGRLKALRLYVPARAQTPRVLFGGQYKWGSRVKEFLINYPSGISQGPSSYSVVTHTVAGMRQGDQVQVSYDPGTGFHNGGLILHALAGMGTGSANTLAVVQQNISAGTINSAAGNLYVRWTRRSA
jgi:hypothetical protein